MHVGFRHRAYFPVDHRLLNRAEDSCHQGREEEPSPLPTREQIIAEEAAFGVARDRGDDDLLSGTVVSRRANDDSGAEFFADSSENRKPTSTTSPRL
ncbi:MAG TPA: hypothetical protein VFF31_32480 [Blastocatellia bacterium]|nr:hypothetical protein [Blastocatellia bacterium]